MKLPRIELETCILRPWTMEDAVSLVRHANNPRVAMNLRDGFPHPYTPQDARSWLTMVGEDRDNLILAIEVEGQAAGGVGIYFQKDVYRFNGEIGYWLAEAFWGRGIMTSTVKAMTAHAFTETRLLRLFASVFSQNPASMKVLEKCGYKRECIHRGSVFKAGKRMDEHYYALLREEWEAQV